MTDDELQKAIKRANLERNYKNAVPSRTSKAIGTIGKAASTAGSLSSIVNAGSNIWDKLKRKKK